MSEIDPAEVVVSTRSGLQEEFSDESEDIPPASTAQMTTEREGLPAGYRMRADARYVEHLTARRAGRTAPDASRALPDGREARDAVGPLLAQLAVDLATIDAAAATLDGDSSRMARRVNVDLIKSQVWRAAWALRAHAILDGAHSPRVRPRPLGFLLGQVRSGWAAECRLAGVTLDVNTSDWNAVVAVDEPAIVAGLTGVVVATLALIGQGDGATLTLRAATAAGALRSVELLQDEVLIAPAVGARFFDASWVDRPGGWIGALGAATAKAVARLHGGDAVFLADERHGSTVRLQFGRPS